MFHRNQFKICYKLVIGYSPLISQAKRAGIGAVGGTALVLIIPDHVHIIAGRKLSRPRKAVITENGQYEQLGLLTEQGIPRVKRVNSESAL